MRLLRNLPGVVAALSLSCSHLPAQKGDAAMAESPWELRLSVTDGIKLRVGLHNRSRTAQVYLYDFNIQPTELILIAPSGKRIEPFDSRSLEKFDNTVYREMYRQAAPGSDVILTEASLESGSNLRWGPFEFTNLPAGAYRAQAVWHSKTNHYYDPKSKRTGVVKDVWLGAVTSNTVEVTVR